MASNLKNDYTPIFGAVAVGYDAAFAFEALAGLQGGSLCGYLGRPTNTVIGDPSLIYIGEGATVEGAFLNTTQGPIYIGAHAEVMEGSMLRGPIAVCEHSVVNIFAFEALAGLQGGSLCGYLGRGQYIAGNEKGVAVGLCGGI